MQACACVDACVYIKAHYGSMSYEWTFDKHADKITRKKAPFWRSFARTPANVTGVRGSLEF
ncbi:MAG: hypothetical protein ACPIOQ_13590 [Promethearchaeia archaeon]